MPDAIVLKCMNAIRQALGGDEMVSFLSVDNPEEDVANGKLTFRIVPNLMTKA